MTNKKEKLYVFGGSFDPFHIGHEAIVSAVLKEFGSILIIPTQNPWKGGGLLELQDRIETLEEFYKEEPRVSVSRLCLKDPEYNFMYKIAEEYYDKSIIFIMGEDAFKSYPQWKNYHDFAHKVDTIVFKRSMEASLPEAPRIRLLPSHLYRNEISSTACRNNLKKNEHLIPEKMRSIIKNRLSKGKS